MKLSKLYEYLDVAEDPLYRDPKGKAKPKVKGPGNLSHLLDSRENRNKFMDTMQGDKKKKKKGKSK